MIQIRPKIIANFAITADGKVSTRCFTPTGFTSSADKRRLQEIRSLGDAILAGKNTVETDNMSMGISDLRLRSRRKRRGLPPVPLRVLVSNTGRLNLKWKVFQNQDSRIVIFSTRKMPPATRRKLPPHVDLLISSASSLRMATILKTLHSVYGVKTLVCEGGPTLFRSLLETGAIDEIYITIAPLIFGGRDAPSLTRLPGKFLKSSRHFHLNKIHQENEELFLHYTAAR